jgi:hypothetical protein
MLNKNIKIYCKIEDNIKVQKVVENYNNEGIMMVDATGELVKISFNCSIFKLNKLRHDIKTLDNLGIKIKEA